jgi:hypothetical protein
MASTTKVPLGASTLIRKWYLDVNTGTYGAPVWTGVFGVEEFKPALDPTVQDDADFDSAGYKSSTITALGWSLELKLARKVKASDATVYDPGQEALRAASMLMGTNNQVDLRWYEVTTNGPKVEAYRGYAAVSWTPDGGAMDALDTVSVTLTGQGARTVITHPDGAPSGVASVTSATPNTALQAGGTLISITGTGFTGTVETTGVKMGVTNFTSWIVMSDNTIVGIVPAKSAGSFEVVVTNASGASTGGPSVTYS